MLPVLIGRPGVFNPMTHFKNVNVAECFEKNKKIRMKKHFFQDTKFILFISTAQ